MSLCALRSGACACLSILSFSSTPYPVPTVQPPAAAVKRYRDDRLTSTSNGTNGHCPSAAVDRSDAPAPAAEPHRHSNGHSSSTSSTSNGHRQSQANLRYTPRLGSASTHTPNGRPLSSRFTVKPLNTLRLLRSRQAHVRAKQQASQSGVSVVTKGRPGMVVVLSAAEKAAQPPTPRATIRDDGDETESNCSSLEDDDDFDGECSQLFECDHQQLNRSRFHCTQT